MAEPVFYDPQRARWKRLRRLVDVLVAALSAEASFQGAQRKRKRQRTRSSEKAGQPLPPEVEVAGVRGEAKSGRRHSGGVLRSLGCGQLFFSARLRPPDRFALSRLAARAHSRRPPAGRGGPEQP